MQVLVRYQLDCGRMGNVNGLFICDAENLKAAYGRTAYFGEILGKHSEIDDKLEESSFKIKSDDQEFIAKLRDVIGGDNISGYNPLDYLPDDDEDEEE